MEGRKKVVGAFRKRVRAAGDGAVSFGRPQDGTARRVSACAVDEKQLL